MWVLDQDHRHMLPAKTSYKNPLFSCYLQPVSLYTTLVSTAFCLAYFLSKKDPVEHTCFTNLKIVGESGTRTPGHLRRNLLLHDLYPMIFTILSTQFEQNSIRIFHGDMAFRGMEPIRSKICINNKTLKQQNTFNYLGYNISYEGERERSEHKSCNFVKVLEIINQIFKPSLVSRHTRIRIYMTLARPVLSYGRKHGQ
jgi:hypothetical protein